VLNKIWFQQSLYKKRLFNKTVKAHLLTINASYKSSLNTC